MLIRQTNAVKVFRGLVAAFDEQPLRHAQVWVGEFRAIAGRLGRGQMQFDLRLAELVEPLGRLFEILDGVVSTDERIQLLQNLAVLEVRGVELFICAVG